MFSRSWVYHDKTENITLLREALSSLLIARENPFYSVGLTTSDDAGNTWHLGRIKNDYFYSMNKQRPKWSTNIHNVVGEIWSSGTALLPVEANSSLLSHYEIACDLDLEARQIMQLEKNKIRQKTD